MKVLRRLYYKGPGLGETIKTIRSFMKEANLDEEARLDEELEAGGVIVKDEIESVDGS